MKRFRHFVIPALIGLGVVGCGDAQIVGTVDSRTKSAFGIHEWAITEDYDGGLSVHVVSSDFETPLITFDRGQVIRSIYLQYDHANDRLVFKLDAPSSGYYGADLDGICDPGSISIHDHPRHEDGNWILASGTKDSQNIDVVLCFSEDDDAKLALASE